MFSARDWLPLEVSVRILQIDTKLIYIALFCTAVPDFQSRIVGGQDARPGQFPYIASVHQGIQGRFLCGSAIINPRWIITSVQCVRHNIVPADLLVVVGSHLISSGGVHHDVRSIVMHPDYISPNISNDVAMVEVTTPFTFNDLVQSIAISFIDIGAPAPAVVSGWGTTEVSWSQVDPRYLD